MKILVLNEFESDLLALIFDGVKLFNEDALKYAKMQENNDAVKALTAVMEEIEKFRRSIFE